LPSTSNKRCRIFLLSPANAGGERGRLLLRERASFDLAVKLRTEGASIGEVFSFISGLYFRGKLAYSEVFAAPPPGVPGCFVIASGRGLMPPDTRITFEELQNIASVPVDAAEPRYREPLERNARILAELAGPDCDIVLLGSIASPKYLEPLVEIFGPRLLFPADFVGRGDMGRGGLMLRCARAGIELNYVPAMGAARHGPRAPNLPRMRRQQRGIAMQAVILIGIQGSGKTSFYRERFADTHTRISLDVLRTRTRERQLLEECLKTGKPFVIDNTNVRASERASYISQAKAAGFRVVGYYFRVPLKAAIARNNRHKPGEVVPVPGLIAAFKRLEPPVAAEGFDELYTVELTPKNEFVVTAAGENQTNAG